MMLGLGVGWDELGWGLSPTLHRSSSTPLVLVLTGLQTGFVAILGESYKCPKTAVKSHHLRALSLIRKPYRIFESTTDEKMQSFHHFHAARKLTQDSAPTK